MGPKFILTGALIGALAFTPAAFAQTKQELYTKTFGKTSIAAATLTAEAYVTKSSTSKSAKVTGRLRGDVHLLGKKIEAAEVSVVGLSSGSSSYVSAQIAGLTVFKKTLGKGKKLVGLPTLSKTLFKTPPFRIFDVGFGSVKVSANAGVEISGSFTIDLASGSSFHAIATGKASAAAFLTGKVKVTILWGVASAGAGVTLKFLDSKFDAKLVANSSGIASSDAKLVNYGVKLYLLVWADALWSLFGFLEWEEVLVDKTWGATTIVLL